MSKKNLMVKKMREGERSEYQQFLLFCQCFLTTVFLGGVVKNLDCEVKCLTLCHTIPTFNDHGKEAFEKHCGKRRKCW